MTYLKKLKQKLAIFFFINVINIIISNPNSIRLASNPTSKVSINITGFYYVGVSNRRGICPNFYMSIIPNFFKS